MTFEELREFFNREGTTTASCFHCHEEGGDLPQVFKNDETLHDTLLTKTIERCENRVLVKPGDPEESALFRVLSGLPCGTVSRMPSGCYASDDPDLNSCTVPSDLERIRLWIAAGAPKE